MNVLFTTPYEGLHNNMSCVLLQVLRVRRGVLRADGIRRRDVGQRHRADDHGLHRRTLRGHLSSVPIAHSLQAVSSCQVRRRHLAAGALPGRTSGKHKLHVNYLHGNN